MEQPKIIVATCLQGRQDTFKYCYGKHDLETVVVYSDETDGDLARELGIYNRFVFPNNPIAAKWDHLIKQLRYIDFDNVILLGLDDYFDDNFLDFVISKAKYYDLISFKDIYFEQGTDFYYWGGYLGQRAGEPAGAGKVYSKALLERLDYSLFGTHLNGGLDSYSWARVKGFTNKIGVFSLMENGLFLCDVKDGKNITDLSIIKNVIKL